MTRRALVTGAAGFVGRHITAALIESGWLVDGYDLDGEAITLAVEELEQRTAVRPRIHRLDALRVFHEHGTRYDLVVHAAAVVGGRTMIEGRPLELAAIDLELDAALWRWALRTGPGRVVYLSSSAAYPVRYQTDDVRAWLREDMLDPLDGLWLEPDATYGLVKLVGERLAVEARAAGIPVTVVRPFSGYGEDQALDYPFPSFIARAVAGDGRANGDRAFEVWGTGEQVRDFIHIDDVVAGILRLVELEVDGPVNLGTGRPTSFLELARLVCNAAGYDPVIRTHPTAPTGVAYRVANVDELHRHYRPRITLEEGIRRALASHPARATHPSPRAAADASRVDRRTATP